MKAAELKKIIKVSIEETCTVGELKSIKNTFKLFKTDAINDLITDCTGIMRERVNDEHEMYIYEYADAEIAAFNSEDYVLTLVAFCSTYDGDSLHKHYRRVFGFFAFSVEDGVITLSDVRPSITVY